MSDELEGEHKEEGRIVTRFGPSVSRRTLLGGAALAIGGAALAACSTSSNGGDTSAATSGTSLLKTIQTRGTLNVTTSLLYPPEFYKDKSGNPAGYDIDVLNLVAKDLNVKLNLINVPDNDETRAKHQT